MTDPITVVALAAGTALVNSVTTDAWNGVKARLATLLGRGNSAREALEAARLEATAAALRRDGSPTTKVSHEQVWQESLEQAIQSDPSIIEQVREILNLPVGSSAAVSGRNVNTGTVHGNVVQAGRISGGVTLGSDPRPRP